MVVDPAGANALRDRILIAELGVQAAGVGGASQDAVVSTLVGQRQAARIIAVHTLVNSAWSVAVSKAVACGALLVERGGVGVDTQWCAAAGGVGGLELAVRSRVACAEGGSVGVDAPAAARAARGTASSRRPGAGPLPGSPAGPPGRSES